MQNPSWMTYDLLIFSEKRRLMRRFSFCPHGSNGCASVFPAYAAKENLPTEIMRTYHIYISFILLVSKEVI